MNTQTIHNYGDGAWGNYTYSFTYDNMNRLTNANSTVVPSESYVYNGDGRFESKNRNGNNIAYNYTNSDNKIESTTVNGSNYSFAYDTKGNVTNDGLNNALPGNYSFRNLPTTMNNFNYTYNDGGERIKKTEVDSAKTDYYLRDYLGRELVVYNYETNDAKEVNIFGNGLIGKIELTDSTIDKYYYLKDHLGSVRSVVENNSSVVSAQDYYPYGETLREYNSALQDLKFTGKQRDNETGYDYSMDRYYINKLGIWNSVERLDNKYYGWSPYSYVLNNPMKFIDPQGTQHEDPNAPEPDFLATLRNLMSSAKQLIFGHGNFEPKHPGNSLDISSESLDKSNKLHNKNNNSFKNLVQGGHQTLDQASDIMFVGGTTAGVTTSLVSPIGGGIVFGIAYTGGTIADIGSIGLKTVDAIFYTGDWDAVTNKIFSTAINEVAGGAWKFVGKNATKIMRDVPEIMNTLLKYHPSTYLKF